MKSLIIIILFVSVSCTNKQKELEYLICKDSIQYWDCEWPRERADSYGFTFNFKKNGDVEKYSFNKKTNKRREFADDPIRFSKKWYVTNDSILKFYNSSSKIIKYSEDTIYTIDLKYKTKINYIRVKGDLHIVKYR